MNHDDNPYLRKSVELREEIVRLSRELVAHDAVAGYALNDDPDVLVHIWRKRFSRAEALNKEYIVAHPEARITTSIRSGGGICISITYPSDDAEGQAS